MARASPAIVSADRSGRRVRLRKARASMSVMSFGSSRYAVRLRRFENDERAADRLDDLTGRLARGLRHGERAPIRTPVAFRRLTPEGSQPLPRFQDGRDLLGLPVPLQPNPADLSIRRHRQHNLDGATASPDPPNHDYA